MRYFYLTLLVLSQHGTDSVSDLKTKFLSILDSSEAKNEDKDIPIIKSLKSFFEDDTEDVPKGHGVLVRRSMLSESTETRREDEYTETHSPATPLPTSKSLKTRRLWRLKKQRETSTSDSHEEEENQFFFDEWEEKRLRQKFASLNSTEPRGNVVNMKAARPWGMTCGDPNQHDVPWGSCTLPAECDAEYRIYRGDSFCGQTSFICCALSRTSYDLYQGLDLSFEHADSLDTDTEDDHNKDQVAKYRARKKRKQLARRKRRVKAMVKKKIRVSIQKIVTAITKLLQKSYRNTTSQRIIKGQKLMEFIKTMKRQYKKDRQTIVDAHDFNMVQYDFKLQDNLNKILGVNEYYMNNDTFRDIVVNGTVNREKLTQLQRTHPMLSFLFTKPNRRMGDGDLETESEKIRPETEEDDLTQEKQTRRYLWYDLEYGIS